ncbi:MAG TPA: DUF1622 domain-containing protein [Gemmatimonadales bacterium]|jgi:uncharacterized membrane protein|nr:DUF1622 domain-containing protein [Gemmatimonadales bacterium]
MKEWLAFLSERAITLIDAVALVVILIGTVEVIVGIVRLSFGTRSHELMRDTWLSYARWLVAALTFQLAADIIETSISSSWETIGRVGAIAVIRTFLNYFLDRDLEEVRARQKQRAARPPEVPP